MNTDECPNWTEAVKETLAEAEISIDLTLDKEKTAIQLSPKGREGKVELVQYSPEKVEVLMGNAWQATGTRAEIMEKITKRVQEGSPADSEKNEEPIKHGENLLMAIVRQVAHLREAKRGPSEKVSGSL